MEKQSLTSLLQITHPIIMAPMFLVSNTKMVVEGMKSGVAGCIPALNYRTLEELKAAIHELKAAKVSGGSFGFNLIVNKSNVKYKEQLRVLCEEGVDFIITSLGSPEETIKEAHKVGIKVFCDVTDLAFAKKVESLGADAIIAVNNQAGGHRGNIDPETLIESIVQVEFPLQYQFDRVAYMDSLNDEDLISYAQDWAKGVRFATPIFDGVKESEFIKLFELAKIDSDGKIVNTLWKKNSKSQKKSSSS